MSTQASERPIALRLPRDSTAGERNIMKPQIYALYVLLALFVVSSASAQQDPTEGYVISLRSIYEGPDANSNTVGFLRPGEYVRLEHVHSLVYKVYRNEETAAAGYVVYPKLSEKRITQPPTPAEVVTSDARGESASTGTVRRTSGDPSSISRGTVTEYSTAVRAASFGTLRWVHRFSNIRAGTGTDTNVIAQLPPGTPVKIGTTIGSWANVFRADEDVLDPDRALGFVHTSLLHEAPPEEPVAVVSKPEIKPETAKSDGATKQDSNGDSQARLADVSILQSLGQQEAPTETAEHDVLNAATAEHIVYVTKTGTKYHTENCRHLRKSKRPITLQEARDKRFEACKTCKPDKKIAESGS